MWTGERARVGAGIYSAWKETAAPPISIRTDQNIFANVATLGSVLANGTRTTDHESDRQPFFFYRGHAGLAATTNLHFKSEPSHKLTSSQNKLYGKA